MNMLSKLNINNKEVYKLKFPDGVYIVKNYLSLQEQLEIGKQALNDFIKPPYRTNLFIYEEDWKDLKNTYN